MDWGGCCFIIRNVHKSQQTDGCPSNSILTLLICLEWSDKFFGGGDVSIDVLYEPGNSLDLISAVFSRYLSCIPSAIKISEAMNV